MKITDKHSIIKLKSKGYSNRKVASLLGVNRKTVARHWNEHLSKTEILTSLDAETKQLQEEITSAPKYNSTNRKTENIMMKSIQRLISF